MLTTYYLRIDGQDLIFWCETKHIGCHRPAISYSDDYAPYSPITYGGL